MGPSPWCRLFAGSAVVVALGVGVVAQQPSPGGSYTADQAASGRTAYDRSCAGCHLRDLSGSTGPGLAGPVFSRSWANKSARELFDLTHATMPQGDEGSLSDEAYVNIIAYILQVNGHAAGAEPLRRDSALLIGAGPASPDAPPPAGSTPSAPASQLPPDARPPGQ